MDRGTGKCAAAVENSRTVGQFPIFTKASSQVSDKQDMLGFQAALENIQKIEAQVDRTARRIACLPLSVQSPSGDTVSLSDDMVTLMKARTDLGATTALIRTEMEMEQHILDVLG
jgi:hypothetical protein